MPEPTFERGRRQETEWLRRSPGAYAALGTRSPGHALPGECFGLPSRRVDRFRQPTSREAGADGSRARSSPVVRGYTTRSAAVLFCRRSRSRSGRRWICSGWPSPGRDEGAWWPSSWHRRWLLPSAAQHVGGVFVGRQKRREASRRGGPYCACVRGCLDRRGKGRGAQFPYPARRRAGPELMAARTRAGPSIRSSPKIGPRTARARLRA